MLGIGPMEMIIILIVALLVLGPRRLPEVLKTIGKVMAELRRTADEVRTELTLDSELNEIRDTVREMQSISTNAVDHLIKEGEKELALEEKEENERKQGTGDEEGSGEDREARKSEEGEGQGDKD